MQVQEWLQEHWFIASCMAVLWILIWQEWREPTHYVDIHKFWKERTRDEARDHRPDDFYTHLYVQELKARIVTGKRPKRNLTDDRPALAHFADAVKRKKELQVLEEEAG